MRGRSYRGKLALFPEMVYIKRESLYTESGYKK